MRSLFDRFRRKKREPELPPPPASPPPAEMRVEAMRRRPPAFLKSEQALNEFLHSKGMPGKITEGKPGGYLAELSRKVFKKIETGMNPLDAYTSTLKREKEIGRLNQISSLRHKKLAEMHPEKVETRKRDVKAQRRLRSARSQLGVAFVEMGAYYSEELGGGKPREFGETEKSLVKEYNDLEIRSFTPKPEHMSQGTFKTLEGRRKIRSRMNEIVRNYADFLDREVTRKDQYAQARQKVEGRMQLLRDQGVEDKDPRMRELKGKKERLIDLQVRIDTYLEMI